MPSENTQRKRKGEILSHHARRGLLSQVEVKAMSIPNVRNGKVMESKMCRRRRWDSGGGATDDVTEQARKREIRQRVKVG